MIRLIALTCVLFTTPGLLALPYAGPFHRPSCDAFLQALGSDDVALSSAHVTSLEELGKTQFNQGWAGMLNEKGRKALNGMVHEQGNAQLHLARGTQVADLIRVANGILESGLLTPDQKLALAAQAAAGPPPSRFVPATVTTGACMLLTYLVMISDLPRHIAEPLGWVGIAASVGSTIWMAYSLRAPSPIMLPVAAPPSQQNENLIDYLSREIAVSPGPFQIPLNLRLMFEQSEIHRTMIHFGRDKESSPFVLVAYPTPPEGL